MSVAPMPAFAPPYYAVIFTSTRTDIENGYAEMATAMDNLAREQPGYLGIDSTRGADGLGITVSYWKDEASIQAWKCNVEHIQAQRLGRDQWYQNFTIHVAKVERSYTLK